MQISKTTINKNDFFAEIIESHLDYFTAQTWNPTILPKFGSLVETKGNNKTIYGIVTSIETGSMDPMHYPFTYKKTEDELKKEQPQIYEFLKTTFNVQVTGFSENLAEEHTTIKTLNLSENETIKARKSTIQYQMIPTPPKIHSFVKNCNDITEKQFFSNPDFLSLLFNIQINNQDDLLFAILKNLKNKNLVTKKYLQSFCNNFSLLNGNDYKRLKLFLRKVQSI